jgi:flagella basal body P-ring formation protein FlgA
LEWPGRPLRKDEAIEAVRNAFAAANTAGETDIDLSGFNPPIVPADVIPVSTVSQLDYDTGTGRFNALLTITGEGINPIDSRISGRVQEMVAAPVTLTRLPSDTVLQPDDIHIARVPSALLQTEVARSVDQIVGMQLRRAVAAGQPLRLADLTPPSLVQRGSMVRIELSSPGLTITGQAIALDTGAQGEKIRVQNITSHAFLFAQVVGPGQVRVAPDAPPALPTAPARFDRRVSMK